MIFPIYTDTPVRRTPLANYGLIAINIAIHLIVYASQHAPGGGSAVSRIEMLGVLDGSQPQLYQFITYQFLHANFAHLIGNMLFLWVFGNNVEDAFGKFGFAVFYLVGGIVATMTHVVIDVDSTVPIVGASGAIAAVMGAYAVLYPGARVWTLVFFFVVNLSKWIPYAWLGLLDLRNMATSLALLPFAPLGVLVGVRLAHRIQPLLFYRLVYAGMLLTGCKLVWDGFAR